MPGGREGMVKEEEFPCTGKLPLRQDQGVPKGRACKAGPRRQNTEKAHFPAHKQLTDLGPDQMVNLGS